MRTAALAFLALAAAVAIVAARPAAIDFFAQDRCLDAGGRWLADEARCEGAREE